MKTIVLLFSLQAILGIASVVALLIWSPQVRAAFGKLFAWIGTIGSSIGLNRPTISSRAFYLTIAFAEIIGIGVLIGALSCFFIGWSVLTFSIALTVWAAALGLTPLINKFLIMVPENSGAVISNTWRSYDKTPNPTRLYETPALRETGPNLQGILLWEKVSWVIDLGKQITIKKEMSVYTADDVELFVAYQIPLTAIQGLLTFLVRYDGQTVADTLDALFRAKLITLFSREYVEAPSGKKNVNQKFESLKRRFKYFLGGPDRIDPETEGQMGTYTGFPQLMSANRSPRFQKGAESLAISKLTATAVEALQKKGLSPRQALMAVLAAQDHPITNFYEIGFEARGLDRLQTVNIAGVPLFNKRGGKSKDKKGEPEE